MTVTPNDLRSLLPQRGTMCLLDAVVAWDASHIVCRSERHRAADNPLKYHERLSCIHGIEFAAQAMAAHRGLVAGSAPAPQVGLLLSVRDCRFLAPRLDDIAESLSIKAVVLGSSGNTQIYRFEVVAGERRLLEGRASVMLQLGAGENEIGRESGARVQKVPRDIGKAAQ